MTPTLNIHTHCQAAQNQRTSQSLSKSVSEPTHGQKRKSTIAQHCIRAIAGEVVKSKSVHLINFRGGGQVIALKSATALILDRCHTLKKMKFRLLTIFLLGLTISCSTTKTSMIVADSYDQTKNVTTLTLLPYGNIEIPGQWTKTKYNEVSRQHFFVDNDSTSIAVTKNPQEKYPFYSEAITDKEFSKKFYEWEKDYYEKQGFEIKEKSSGDNFVIWTANGNNANTIFLYGAKNKYAYNFAVFTNNWTEEKRAEFLKKLFEEN